LLVHRPTDVALLAVIANNIITINKVGALWNFYIVVYAENVIIPALF
jgi:hypothetical protein